MGSITYLTVFRFSIQLIICETAFLAIRPRKPQFLLRSISALGFHFLCAFVWFFLLSEIKSAAPWPSVLFFLGITGFSIISLLFCFDIDPIEMLFIGTCGYATEHITFAITRVLLYFLGLTNVSLPTIIDYIFIRFGNYIIVSVLMNLFVVKKNAEYETFDNKVNLKFIRLAIIAMLSAIILSVLYTNADYNPETAIYTHFLCPLYSALCCLLIIYIEYYTFKEFRATLESEQMEQMLEISETQRIANKEAIDIINIRCHDLKHQMKVLMAMSNNNPSELDDYLESVKRATSIYDAIYHTGNDALDYILREKSLLADEKGIEFSCMADGTALNFMQQVDIYALMGNALDNALEQLEKEQSEERVLSLQIQKKAGVVIIRLENTCTSNPIFKNSIPVSSKENHYIHGFGMRSIKYVAQKYGGDLIIEAKNNIFTLTVVI